MSEAWQYDDAMKAWDEDEPLTVPCPTCGGDGAIYEDARKVLGYLGQPGSRVWRAECSNPSCVGGRVVSESVIEEMAAAVYNRDDAYTLKWEYQDEDVKDWYRDKARAAARVVLEHMEDNERTTG